MVRQDYVKNLAKTIHTQKKSVGNWFSQHSTAQEFMTTLSQKSYYENNSLLYYTTIFFALISQLATAISSYTFFADLLAIKVTPIILPFAVATLLILIEVLKYVSFNKGLEGVFALPQRINYALLVFATLLCVVSMYASITGGGNFGIDTQRITSTETKFDAEIATLRTEIAEIHKRNTWKNQTWLPKKEKALLYQKENQLAQAKTDKEKALNTVAQDNEIAATQYKFCFAFFDTLFILCTLYVWYFRKQVAIEAMVEQTTVNSYQGSVSSHQLPVNSNHVAATKQVLKPPHRNYLRNTPLIFEVQKRGVKKNIDDENRNNENRQEEELMSEIHDENRINENRLSIIGVRNCLQCQTEFVANHKKQKYCCDDCRKESWENKTHRPLILKKKSAIVQPLDLFT